MSKRDLAVIGGGPGGLVVASVAAQLGLKVTLVEASDRLGGDCLHSGCVPSKSVIHAAKLAHLMRRGPEYGLPACEPQVDLDAVHDRVRAVIDRIQEHDDPERFRGYGCEVLFGAARFTGPDTIEVNGETVAARRFVIATGSRPAVPPIEGLEEAGYLTNEQVFSLEALPPRLAVLGGGPIGVELAQAYARLGSRVTVLQRGPTLLPREDPEAARLLEEVFAAEGMAVVTGAEPIRVERDGDGRVLHYRQDGGDHALECDAILVAVGRRPAVEGLNLEAAGVETERGAVRVDRRLRSSNPRIFACGDVAGPYQFTHMAEYQAGVVLANAVFRVPKKVDYRVVPWVTYTDPEIGHVGLTEAEAAEQGVDVEVLRFPLKDLDRAIVEGEDKGFAKLLVKKGPRFRGGGRIVGATLMGSHAGELLHEVVLAMQAKVPIATLSAAIHAYPTRAQVLRRTVNTHFSAALFSNRTRRVVQWLNRLIP